ncbi:MAG: hypothetical protein R3F22_04570 [Lysobacteraceae bacterium]
MLRPVMLASALLLATTICSAADTRGDSPDQNNGKNVLETDCDDDQGTDRCSDAAQRRMRDLYGMADAESLSAQGVSLRRAMIVNGYGLDIVAITFNRVPGRPPMVAVDTPQQETGPRPQPLTSVVSEGTWRQVLDASRDFDQQLARELPANGEQQKGICLHSWFVVVEAVDPAHLSQRVVGQYEVPAKISRDAEGACAQGLAMRYAFELARIAREQLPECSSLNVDDFRNNADLLALCHRLGGDRLAASDAYRFLKKLSGNGMPVQSEFKRFKSRNFATSSQHLADSFITALKGGDFSFAAPEATDLDHASAVGTVYFSADEGDQIADIKLNLVRQNRDFVILSYELSGKRPYQ